MTDDEVQEHTRRVPAGARRNFNEDGSVHVMPRLYVVLAGHLAFYADPTSRKIKNLRRDPRITCLVETGTDFSKLRAVQFAGHADVIDDRDTSLRVSETMLTRYGDEHRACSGRILGRWFDLGLRHRHDRHPCLSRWLTGCW
jgi:nitroimidazol reductase NimA-like FMN-containing flavoprotein (pyridoxamine 5'-phosphate oxidase superfamily)